MTIYNVRLCSLNVFHWGGWGGKSLLQWILLFLIYIGQVGSEWEVASVTDNCQRGNNERIREKMLKISEIARANNRAEEQSEEASSANKGALEERVEEAEAAVRGESQSQRCREQS